MQGYLPGVAIDCAGSDPGCRRHDRGHFLFATQRGEQYLDGWWRNLAADFAAGVGRRVNVDVIAAGLHRVELRGVQCGFCRPVRDVLGVLREADGDSAGRAGKAVMDMSRRRIVHAGCIRMCDERRGHRVDGDREGTAGRRGDRGHGLVAAQPAERKDNVLGNDLAADLAARVRRSVNVDVCLASQ
jgi:hypothetical protein